eukprot:scaffold49977_cov23-Tisochrysis_lutea.AAC.2
MARRSRLAAWSSSPCSSSATSSRRSSSAQSADERLTFCRCWMEMAAAGGDRAAAPLSAASGTPVASISARDHCSETPAAAAQAAEHAASRGTCRSRITGLARPGTAARRPAGQPRQPSHVVIEHGPLFAQRGGVCLQLEPRLDEPPLALRGRRAPVDRHMFEPGDECLRRATLQRAAQPLRHRAALRVGAPAHLLGHLRVVEQRAAICKRREVGCAQPAAAARVEHAQQHSRHKDRLRGLHLRGQVGRSLGELPDSFERLARVSVVGMPQHYQKPAAIIGRPKRRAGPGTAERGRVARRDGLRCARGCRRRAARHHGSDARLELTQCGSQVLESRT